MMIFKGNFTLFRSIKKALNSLQLATLDSKLKSVLENWIHKTHRTISTKSMLGRLIKAKKQSRKTSRTLTLTYVISCAPRNMSVYDSAYNIWLSYARLQQH